MSDTTNTGMTDDVTITTIRTANTNGTSPPKPQSISKPAEFFVMPSAASYSELMPSSVGHAAVISLHAFATLAVVLML